MSVRIRLARHGMKKRPFYHIVVADSRAKRDGRFIERVGDYNPMLTRDHSDRLHLSEDRIRYWLGVGAQPSDRVARFLGTAGIIAPFDPTIKKKTQTLKPSPGKKAQKRQQARAEKQAAQKEAEAAPAEETPIEETPTEETPEIAPKAENSTES